MSHQQSDENFSTPTKVRPSAEKFATWNTLSTNDRLDRIGTSIQKVRDRPYYQSNYKPEAKFQKGDPICLCFEGIYYHAVIQSVNKESFYCSELKKDVPLYTVKYPGWEK
ncbi:hypothetical protein BV898_13705 [Hypsibius exemplaris]|uniref:Uncharacterized protein n=1 Tax=Hypsibius exemplaris TaxID=2072580 RepID=A0A1W0W9U9_HYPEX|nr:hypothetical protein BV898_13705 [Hypsibius exemplaris]